MTDSLGAAFGRCPDTDDLWIRPCEDPDQYYDTSEPDWFIEDFVGDPTPDSPSR